MPVRKTFTDHSNVLYQQSVMIFVDHRPNFQWRQLCQTMLTCLPGTWSNQHSLQPGACGLCAGASKVIANFGEIFSIYYLFPPGHHQSFAGLLVCVQQRGHHLVSSHLRNSTIYIRLIRHLHQCEKKMFPICPISLSAVPCLFNIPFNETVILVHESQLNIHQWY